MKNIISSLLILRISILAFFTVYFFSIQASNVSIINRLNFKQISAYNKLPTNEVHKVFQDKDGFIWIGTSHGICKYDGYQITSYKSSLATPNLLTSNNIFCIGDDYNKQIWIGTQKGLNVLNKKTGEIKKYLSPQITNNTVSCLCITKNNTVWIGTDGGLCKYNPKLDSFILYTGKITGNILPPAAIKSIYEDSDGDLWIGTWAQGLYRYSIKKNMFYKYPSFNPSNSAHVIFQDSYKNMWIGTWDEGVYLLKKPKDMKNVSWVNYRHNPNRENSLSDNIIYSFTEDVNTNTIWIGTRSGLSIIKKDLSDSFVNYGSHQTSRQIFCNEANSIIRDNDNHIWIGAIGEGVLMVDTKEPYFTKKRFDLMGKNIQTSAVQSLYVDNNNLVWIGMGSYGLARHNPETNELLFYSNISEFSKIKFMATVHHILSLNNEHEIWFGTYGSGIYVYKKGEQVKILNTQNCDFLNNDCITSLYEDKKGNKWIGTRVGLGVKRNDGSSYLFYEMVVQNKKIHECYIKDIKEDSEGNIWLATTDYGIIKISGNIKFPQTLTYKIYGVSSSKNMILSAQCLHIDSQKRLWAGTEYGGLLLFDKKTDLFYPKNKEYSIAGDIVSSIEEDKQGNLWLGTNEGLVRIHVNADGKANTKTYNSADGLQDNSFISGSSFCKNGKMFFGTYKGYYSFNPETIKENYSYSPSFITDIKICNQSLNSLEQNLRKEISLLTPPYCDKISIPYKYNNFSIEFATLSYNNPEQNKYAYKLQGFDSEWQYTDATRRFAYYNNLKSGTYTFLLKTTNESGIWRDTIKQITIVVLPPFWATWWAYCIYFIIIGIVLFLTQRVIKSRIVLNNQLHLKEIEKEKEKELNHTKLEFFTNITHELLTPLSIISATTDELKVIAPQHTNLYSVMSNNTNRLIRLIQQILEFRKAESGNLKLQVSPGNIAEFVVNKAEYFQPLIKKQKLHFSVLCDPETIYGYFDSDKLEKILYNLLSNAAKYNSEGAFIQLTLSYAESKDFIQLTLKDNGQGISTEKLEKLFSKFYEGEHRRFNTIGTGIGLSLTKDLVELHGGKIHVESEVNVGTTFYVTLPIDSSYYNKEQINEETLHIKDGGEQISSIENDGSKDLQTSKQHSILIVEDNEELLQLMTKLLSRQYNIFTAENGKEAIVIIENEDIDLIVSDIMMPEMNGVEFCQYLKSKLEYCHIPIILLTAKNKEEDRAEAYESGADGYICKPFNLIVLHARIRNLLKYKERMAHDFKKQLVFEVKNLNYTSIDEEFMQKAIDCVNRHLDDSFFDQTQFVEEMGTSKSTLYKKLKSLTGLNTSAFIRNIRLKAAYKIMEEKGSSVRISELAYIVGFNDPKYFSSCFKKEFGILPSEYIEQLIEESDKQ